MISANSKIPWKSRDVFTDAIFGIFVDVVKLDGNYMKARCSLCDEDNPANVKSFSKGNTSNLKTHLKRVCIKTFSHNLKDCFDKLLNLYFFTRSGASKSV